MREQNTTNFKFARKTFSGPRRNTSSSGGSGSFRGRSFGGGQRNPRRRGGFGERMDVSLFIKKASTDAAPIVVVPIQHAFSDFKFCKELELNLKEKNYTTPTPVQDQAIPVVMQGKDIVGLANTGTGKTAAFLLPLLDKLSQNKRQRVLIMAPTRELALQIDTEFREFAKGMGLYSTVCVGGMPIYRQITSLKRYPHFVIGTPGRLKDLSDRKVIDFSSFENIVLDEVDHMLDMGFIDAIREILSQLPKERHSLFFSATMPPRIKELISQFSKNPTFIEIQSGHRADTIEQDVIRVKDKKNKFAELENLLAQPELEKVLIFSETKRDVEQLTRDLIKKGFKAQSIHGDKRQRERQRALDAFRANTSNILVATDVAARGLDIKDITHVINYTIPQTHEDYTHRIGRTGRGMSKGKAYTFV